MTGGYYNAGNIRTGSPESAPSYWRIRNDSLQNGKLCLGRYRPTDQAVFPKICPGRSTDQTAAAPVFIIPEDDGRRTAVPQE